MTHKITHRKIDIVDRDGDIVCRVIAEKLKTGSILNAPAKERANRLVDCVNLLQGIQPEDFEQVKEILREFVSCR